MSSVTQKTPSPPSIEIDGVLHRQCGDGRRQRRSGAIECREIKPLSAEYWPVNSAYTDGFGIVCLTCREKQATRYADRLAGAIVPIKVYDDVPIGADGICRGVAIEIDGEQVPHLVVVEACRYWGLDSGAQIDRIENDPTLLAGLTVVKLTTVTGAKWAYALRYDLVPLWLAGIETKRMRDRARAQQLADYQRTCGEVLADYFFGTKTAPPPPAQRIEADTALATHGDMAILQYIDTALGQAVKQAMAPVYQRLEMLDAMPRIDRNTQYAATSLSGATHIHTETVFDVRGVVYVCRYPRMAWPDSDEYYAKGWDRYAIGWTTKLDVEERLKEYPGKYDIQHPDEVYVIKADSSKLETLIHHRKPKSGVEKVPYKKDVFWLAPDTLKLLLQLPNRLSYEEANNRLWHWAMIRKGSDIQFGK